MPNTLSRGLLSLIIAVPALAQTYQRHGPNLLLPNVVAAAVDPTVGRLAAVMGDLAGWPSPAMFVRIAGRWHAAGDATPTLRRLVPDIQRQRLVGLAQDFQTLRTWEWDGATWTLRHTMQLTQSPSSLLACYHAGLGRVVLIDPLAQTLTWDGASWQPIASAPVTGEWGNGELIYDTARGRVVWYSGAELWEFAGGAWQQRSLSPMPPARSEFAFVYDPIRQLAVMFGGFDNGTLQDTWEYDGNQWFARAPMLQPPGRMRHAMAFDPGTQRVVLIGGYGFSDTTQFGPYHNDEWEWDGQAWSAVQLDRRPPPTDEVGMAIDPVGGGVLLTTSRWTPSGKHVWRWTGADWSALPPTAAVPTNLNAMCTDPGRGAIWCYDATIIPRTWQFNGSSWQVVSPANQPSTRLGAAIAYDRVRNVAVLFGGGTYVTTFAETWEWNGSDWTQRFPATSPDARTNHSMAFDPVSNRVLMTGGQTGTLHPTWAFDGANWINLGQSVYAVHALRLVEDWSRSRVLRWDGTGSTAEWNGSTWLPWATPMPPLLQSSRNLSAGASFEDTLVVFDRGDTWVVSPFGAETASYGNGCGSPAPRLAASGWPTPGTTDFSLATDRATPSGLAIVLGALSPDNVPIGACSLLLQNPVMVGLSPVAANGTAATAFNVPRASHLFGLDVYWQAITLDNVGLGFTEGVRTRLGY